MRRLLFALTLLFAAPASARIKIDRYEPATLPKVKVWVTMLDEVRPVTPAQIRNFSLYVNGELLRDGAEWQTAEELGEPMAIAIVADARFPERWNGARQALNHVVEGLPEESIAFGVVTHEGSERLPKDGWSQTPSELPASMKQIVGSGAEPRLYRGVRMALKAFPLAPGLEAEPSDGELPKPPKKGEPPFPEDRVLYVLGDGEMEQDASRSVSDNLRDLVYMARRRGVRVMSIGVTGEQADWLWTLRVLARKTGGTFRRAPTASDLPLAAKNANAELKGRFVVEGEAPNLRRGDDANIMVRAQTTRGITETSREYSARVKNVLGWWDAFVDWISDLWEKWPWWVRTLIIVGFLLIVTLIVLVILVRKTRKRNAFNEAAVAAREAALASRTPCAVCGQMMMPQWTECMFCKASQAAERPMRFRLTGRAGVWMGQALRFDKELITLGAGPDCDVQIVDRGVAVQHAGLRDRGDDEFMLTDFNTDGGTWVNGERITQCVLDEGDLLRIGECEFVFGIEA